MRLDFTPLFDPRVLVWVVIVIAVILTLCAG